MKFSTIASTMAAVAIPAVSAAPVASPAHLATNDMGTGLGKLVDGIAKTTRLNRRATLGESKGGILDAIFGGSGDGVVNEPIKGSRDGGLDGILGGSGGGTLDGIIGGSGGIFKRQEGPSGAGDGDLDGILGDDTFDNALGGSGNGGLDNALRGSGGGTLGGILGGLGIFERQEGAAGKNGKFGIKRTDIGEHEEEAGIDEFEDIVDELLGSLDGEEKDEEHTKPVEHTKPMGQKYPTQMKRTEHKMAAAGEYDEVANELPVNDLGEGLEDLADELAGMADDDEEEETETMPHWNGPVHAEADAVMKAAVMKRQEDEEIDELLAFIAELTQGASGNGEGNGGLTGNLPVEGLLSG
ncbi:hypothetical protein Alg215_08941 [Pyrenophora tritici-repentis]|nr:hypothetical protein Alg215_08941 [Pyrenophora tritici-repentis]